VTVGVISALKRTIQAEKGVFENLMQTDAHINRETAAAAGHAAARSSGSIRPTSLRPRHRLSIPMSLAKHIA